MNKNIFSSDEFPARTNYSTEEAEATETVSTTKKVVNRAFRNKEFIAIVCGVLYYIGTQFVAQPYVDKAQDQRMMQIEKDITEIKEILNSRLVSQSPKVRADL